MGKRHYLTLTRLTEKTQDIHEDRLVTGIPSTTSGDCVPIIHPNIGGTS